MQLNGNLIIDRHNRPNVLQPVGLRALFINDGVYQDPVAISGVTIFREDNNFPPSSILGGDGLLSTSLTKDQILMHFGASGGFQVAAATSAACYNPDSDPSSLSGIFRMGTGEYVVVLDGQRSYPGGQYAFHGSGTSVHIQNAASSVANYIDVWTVQLAAGSTYQSMINNFSLFKDKFFMITEPLLLKTTNKLLNKKIVFGSKVDLKISTEVSLENKSISEAVHNIFKDSVVTSAMIDIKKLNESTNLGSHVTVSSFSDTSAVVDITSDNTIILNWDTEALKTHASTLSGAMGSLTGPYAMQVKYSVLNQTIVTPLMHFMVV
jgi:hypothetical protein